MSSSETHSQTELLKRCGEIFLTIKEDLIFMCTHCEYSAKEFPTFLKHINKHWNNIIVKDACLQDNELDCTDRTHSSSELWSDELSIKFIEDSADTPTTKQLQHEHGENLENISDEILDDVDEIKPDLNFEFILLNKSPKRRNDIKQIKNKTSKLISSQESQQKMCPDNIRKINTRQRLKLPLDSTERKHRCEICGFGFRESSNLAAHKRRHYDKEKKYECENCSKRFYSHTELRTHSRRHTNERPYLCPECGKSFVTSGALSTHTKRHRNIRDNVCSICHKGFYDEVMLKDHMLTHSSERNHKCTHCDAAFARRKALKCHLKLHENKREYFCELCPSRFNQGPGLYSHLKSKHKLTNATVNKMKLVHNSM